MLKRLVSTVVCILLVIAFAPRQLGGATTYAVIFGNSMEPAFQEGDLVLLRQSADYSINDLVLYQHPDIGPVFHRIVEIENDQFVLKGDHNSWTDPFQVSRQDILGKYWFSIPWLGSALSFLHTLEGLSVTSVLAGGLVIGTKLSSPSPKRDRNNNKKKRDRSAAADLLASSSISVREAFLYSLASLLILLPIATYAFVSPTYITAATEFPYQQVGEFSYSSDVPAIGIYDQGYLKPGDPIFRRISNHFDLKFTYNLLAEGLQGTRGAYSLSLIVGETDGWTRTVELIPTTEFVGSSVTVNSRISIDDMQAIVDNLEQITGIELSQYNLIIQPRVQVIGLVQGAVLQTEYSPQLPFMVDDMEVRPNINVSDKEELLTQVETGAVVGSTQAVNGLGLLNLRINIQVLRILLLLLVPAIAVAAFVTGRQWLKLSRTGAVERITSQYGPKLVNVNGMFQNSQMKQISVHKIEDLVRIADREGSSIFHEETADAHYYFVEGRNGIYAFRLDPGGQG